MPAARLVAVNDQGRRIGEDNPMARLTNHEIDLLFSLHAQGYGQKRLAAMFEVGRRTVRDILAGRRRGQPAAAWRRVQA